MELPSWREVMYPQREIRRNELQNSSFAANLTDLENPNADSEYREPEKFFARTFLTDGLKTLLLTALKRVTRKGGDPVIQLKTSFGGGKTHSLLAIYHLFSGKNDLLKNSDILAMVESIGLKKIPEDIKIAKMVGTEVSIERMWEYLATQLTSDKKILEDFRIDRDPGSLAIRKLLDSSGACVILIDELVAYARKFYKTPTFDRILTFVQSLTEAVTSSARSVLVVSLPESKIEYGGEGGESAANYLEHVFQRLNMIWKPVTMEESFAIVRQRLFERCLDEDARRKICNAFEDMYTANSSEFPSECSQSKYAEELFSCYPIHPKIFHDLFDRWATAFSNFQRTRGVLRFMAHVIANLYQKNDPNCIIMPGSIPFDDKDVRAELLKCFSSEESKIWENIVDSEIEKDHVFEDPILKKIDATHRVARAVFLATAPTGRESGTRGISRKAVHLATMFPSEINKTPHFNSALEQLKENLVYFYQNDSRYWFDSRATVQKRARELESKISDEKLFDRISDEAWKIWRSLQKPRAYRPKNPEDPTLPIPKEVILILLPVSEYHIGRDQNSRAINRAKFYFEHLSESKNLYLFFAVSEEELNKTKSTAKTLMAWEMVEEEGENGSLNLDTHQRKEISTWKSKSRQTFDSTVRELYRFVICPKADRINKKEIHWLDVEVKKDLLQTLKDQELLFEKISPRVLKNLIVEFYDERQVSVEKLWYDVSKYTYMPRLMNRDALDLSIQNIVADGKIYLEDGLLMLDPPTQSEPEVIEEKPIESHESRESIESVENPSEAIEKPKTRFHFDAKIQPQDLERQISRIVSNIINNLPAGAMGNITISADIAAESFSEEDQSILSDESKNLKINFNFK